MASLLTFIAYWLGMMALIGGALWLVQKFKPKKDSDENRS